ncbi:3-oxoacyl-[acyl-carrier-protein] synthase, mitochondrial-like [Haliotis rufescens]|uniref:3-oxoacyl-[acyl-carrier-protein] synthase, mitochondrial-like n=1 Tax=Haliotis rufescens TaxID=6454 RepID=UPI00201F9CD1|nr:3-oxoacyl-[acyl-carrier-protein] synthase, mitochondrial-like [Haliotis rufescens]
MSGISPSGRRVVVTGVGLVTSLGVGVKHVWRRLTNGECGISKLTGSEYDNIPCKVAGQVPRGPGEGNLDLDRHFSAATLREIPLSAAYAVLAAEEAMASAGWSPGSEEEEHRSGVAIGTGMVDLEEVTKTGMVLRERGYKRVSPHFVPKILVNMPAGHVSIRCKLKGPNHAVSTACTTGLHAIGDAARFILHGDADVMVAGSTEACVGPVAIAGFARMRALSTNFNENPNKASRPFDKNRDGFVMSEGAGMVVLEELEHAKTRGAPILAEVLGYGLSGDGYHITTPSQDGSGAERCMKAAMKDAGLDPKDVGYINAHATSTPIGDAVESKAIEKTFKGDNSAVLVSSTKGALGHLLGAAGSVEAVFTVLACQTGCIPPTINLDTPDEGCHLDLVANRSVTWSGNGVQRVALTNSFGFGGTNGSLCIAQYME